MKTKKKTAATLPAACAARAEVLQGPDGTHLFKAQVPPSYSRPARPDRLSGLRPEALCKLPHWARNSLCAPSLKRSGHWVMYLVTRWRKGERSFPGMGEERRAEVSVLWGERRLIGFPKFSLLAVVTMNGVLEGVCTMNLDVYPLCCSNMWGTKAAQMFV